MLEAPLFLGASAVVSRSPSISARKPPRTWTRGNPRYLICCEALRGFALHSCNLRVHKAVAPINTISRKAVLFPPRGALFQIFDSHRAGQQRAERNETPPRNGDASVRNAQPARAAWRSTAMTMQAELFKSTSRPMHDTDASSAIQTNGPVGSMSGRFQIFIVKLRRRQAAFW